MSVHVVALAETPGRGLQREGFITIVQWSLPWIASRPVVPLLLERFNCHFYGFCNYRSDTSLHDAECLRFGIVTESSTTLNGFCHELRQARGCRYCQSVYMVNFSIFHMSVHVVARRWWPGTWFTDRVLHLEALQRILPWMASIPRLLVLAERLNYQLWTRRCTTRRAWDCRLSQCPSRDSAVNCIKSRGALLPQRFDRSVHFVVHRGPGIAFMHRIVYLDVLQRIPPWIRWISGVLLWPERLICSIFNFP
jgi:hypothetical protein